MILVYAALLSNRRRAAGLPQRPCPRDVCICDHGSIPLLRAGSLREYIPCCWRSETVRPGSCLATSVCTDLAHVAESLGIPYAVMVSSFCGKGPCEVGTEVRERSP
jgi:hypothetical protein